MKRKDQIKIAKRIADAEVIISTCSDNEKVMRAKEEVMRLSNQINTFEDMCEIEVLAKKFIEEKIGL